MAKFFGDSHFWFQNDDKCGAEAAISSGMERESFLCLEHNEPPASPEAEDDFLLAA